MPPLVVATVEALTGRLWLARIAVQPLFDHVMVKLFVPEETGQGLALNRAILFVQSFWRKLGVKLVCFRPPQFEHRIEIGERFSARFIKVARQPQSHRNCFACRNVELVVRTRFCPELRRIDDVDLALDDTIVDRILHEWRYIRNAPESLRVAFVFSEENVVG